MDLTDIPLIDDHCHGVLREDLDQLAFESLLNEASGRSRWGTTLFDSMLGRGVRRWCAPKLGLEEFATPEGYIARQNELGFDEVVAEELITGNVRLAHLVMHSYLAWTAIEVRLPLQFHVGYGDNDVDLANCDPLKLAGFLGATQDRDVPVLLLHNYPFHRNAAYLAQVFGHFFVDVGLATHNAAALSQTLIRELLELAPFGKVLFSSDAFGLPELHYLGALLFRRSLDRVLSELDASGDLCPGDAQRIGELVASGNARRAYGLGSAK